MSYLRYYCLFVYNGVQHIMCGVFVLFFFVLCTLCCQFLWIVPFLIASSVLSNVYLRQVVHLYHTDHAMCCVYPTAQKLDPVTQITE